MEELKINMRKIIREIMDEYITEKKIRIPKPRKSIKKPDFKEFGKKIKSTLGGFITWLRNLKVREFLGNIVQKYKDMVSKRSDKKLEHDKIKLEESIKRREARKNGS